MVLFTSWETGKPCEVDHVAMLDRYKAVELGLPPAYITSEEAPTMCGSSRLHYSGR